MRKSKASEWRSAAATGKTLGALRGCAAAGGLVVSLWAPALAADEYPASPLEILEDVDVGLSQVAKMLKDNGVTGLESVVVVSTTGKTTTFANPKTAPASVHFDIDEAELAIPWNNTNTSTPHWKRDYQEFTMIYTASPGTVLRCGPPLNGRRNCTQN